MPYYRSNAYKISQRFQKVLIYYFTIFILITMNFQIHHSNLPKSKKSNVNLASGSLRKTEIKRQRRGPQEHYSNESWLRRTALPLCRIVAHGP